MPRRWASSARAGTGVTATASNQVRLNSAEGRRSIAGLFAFVGFDLLCQKEPMPNAIRIHRTGGPEVLTFEPIEVPAPGPGEVQLRHTFVGVNFIDTYHRTGLYPLQLPVVLGQEGVGRILAIGPQVASLQVGDRVAYASVPGAWAEERNVPAARLLKVPDSISDEIAAAVMLKGMTAEYLVRRTYPVKRGDTVLFHAAAGGVGTLACQWARALGARVIGAVSSPQKVAIAKANGCEAVVVTTQRNFVSFVQAFTKGVGADVVYDSVGAETFDGSLACLKSRGMLVSFGQSSGKVPQLDVGRLGGERSLFVTRPSLHAYTATRQELEACAGALFEGIAKGWLKVPTPRKFALKDAAQAQGLLESRRSTGPMVLVVDEALASAPRVPTRRTAKKTKSPGKSTAKAKARTRRAKK
jgi:NADPH2:quinone reductase